MYKSRCKPKMVAYPQKTKTICNKCIMGKFTFTYLADAFIQSDLQYIQAIHFFYEYVCSLGIEPTTVCAANAMLFHWATGTKSEK